MGPEPLRPTGGPGPGTTLHRDQHLAEFSAFYEREARRLIRSVSLATGEPALAEDAVAEAFARAWLRWPQVRLDPRPPVAWVLHVALNECRGRFRRRTVERRKAHLVARPDEVHDPEPAPGPVWEAVAQLPERDRLLIALRYVADLRQDEIAGVLGVAAGTVASGLHRVRRRLGVELEPVDEEMCDG